MMLLLFLELGLLSLLFRLALSAWGTYIVPHAAEVTERNFARSMIAGSLRVFVENFSMERAVVTNWLVGAKQCVATRQLRVATARWLALGKNRGLSLFALIVHLSALAAISTIAPRTLCCRNCLFLFEIERWMQWNKEQ